MASKSVMVSANKLLLLAMALLLVASSAHARAPAPAPAPGPGPSSSQGLCPAGFKNRAELDAETKLDHPGNLEFIFTTSLTSTIITKPTNHTVCVCAYARATAVHNPIIASSGNTIICVTLAPAPPTTSAPTPSPAPMTISVPTPSPSPAPAPMTSAPTPSPSPAPAPTPTPAPAPSPAPVPSSSGQVVCPVGFKSRAEYEAAAQGSDALMFSLDGAIAISKPTHAGLTKCVCHSVANLRGLVGSGSVAIRCTSA